jgi:DNA-binding NtrC family response regulator
MSEEEPTRGARVLVIDDEKPIGLTCRRILEAEGHEVSVSTSGLEGVRLAIEGSFEVVLLDLKMPDISGMEALEQILGMRPELSVIIITGYASIQTSIEAIKKGAFHYVPKPFTPEELAMAVGKALEDRRMRSENRFLREELARLQQTTKLLGRSKAMEDLRRQILKIAASSFTVTIYGESGTGKELVASAIHEHSPRAAGPFVAVDISSLSPALVESELFGHVKGAFTGATRSRPGMFQIAKGGTLFLDELASLALEVQGKLLRVLEARQVRPVGSEIEQAIDVRIVAATNRDLYQLVEQGRFREDLYYRLNVIPLTLPPLRERSDDVPLLATHFLRRACEESGSQLDGFSTAAMAKLLAWHWPGNVRELKNVVERLVATVDGSLIDIEALPLELRGGQSRCDEAIALAGVPRTADELKEAKRQVKAIAYEQVERAFLARALKENDGNVSRAAEAVGMARPNLHALMRRYGLRAKAKGSE